MLRALRWLLIVLDAGTWGAVVFFATMVAGLLLRMRFALSLVERSTLPGAEARLLQLFIAMFLIGCLTGAAVDLLFRRLLAMLGTVAARRPFVAANARRLRHIAWALLAIQLLDLAFGVVVHGINGSVRHPVFVWSPSLTGWLAVLLLFVLAHVFAQGSAMQDEIEATV